jgi:phosphomethylpyrimidine synthase
MTATLPESPAHSYGDAFPNSTKVYLEGSRDIRVPMREIALSGGEPPLRVYDTSGPGVRDVVEGLRSVRGAWIGERVVAVGRSGGQPPDRLRGRSTVTQLHYARLGEITPEMEYAAIREGVPAELVRDGSPAGAPSSPPTSTTPSWSR